MLAARSSIRLQEPASTRLNLLALKMRAAKCGDLKTQSQVFRDRKFIKPHKCARMNAQRFVSIFSDMCVVGEL